MSSRTQRVPIWDKYFTATVHQGNDSIDLIWWCNMCNMDSYYLFINSRGAKEVFAATIRGELEQFSDLADFFVAARAEEE